jgi:hypothetical protein
MISDRTKRARQAAKERGKVLGNAKGYQFKEGVQEAGAAAAGRRRVPLIERFQGRRAKPAGDCCGTERQGDTDATGEGMDRQGRQECPGEGTGSTILAAGWYTWCTFIHRMETTIRGNHTKRQDVDAQAVKNALKPKARID